MATTYLKLGNTDYSAYVKNLKVDREFLVSDKSGRNAKGDMTVDLINNKYKVSVTFIPMTVARAQTILNAVSSYVVNVSFLNPWTNSLKAIQAYISTPSIDYYTIQDNTKIVNGFTINFIEL